MTGADILEAFAVDEERRGCRPVTIEGRCRVLRALFYDIGERDVMEVTRRELEDWIARRQLGRQSRVTYISYLRVFFDFARRAELRLDNPATDIPMPRLARRVPRPISPDSLSVALAAADSRMRAWLCLGAFQGFRCMEIAGLRREDVMEDRAPALLLVSNPKGGRERLLPLHPEVFRALVDYGLPRRRGQSGFVFLRDDGEPVTAQNVSLFMGRYLHGLGIDCSAHQLRHHFGTETYRRSKDLRMVQELMGHNDPRTTAGYAAWNPAEAVAIVAGLGT